MSIFQEISEALQKSKKKMVLELIQKALDEGHGAESILNDGLLAGMDVIGTKFKNNEVFIPEVMMAARAMNEGTALLKPHLAEAGAKSLGKAIIGTVKGDLHDIGKNLVRLMVEGKGIEVIDLGVDVPTEKFYEAYVEHGANLILCSALLTTTMGAIKEVVDYFVEKGARDKVTIMIGGAPITQDYCKTVGADIYSPDAASAADVAKEMLLKKAG